MLDKISLGRHYFTIALMLRESYFLNGILTNCESWYNLTKKNIQDLEDLDKILLQKVLKTPFSVPTEALYLELGCLNIGTIIKARRLNFLHYLLNQSESECSIIFL